MQSLKLGSTCLWVVISAALPSWAADYGSPTWRHDFHSAEAEAKRENRPLLVHFHAKWCGPCQTMNREVLSDPVVLRQIEASVIAVKIDSDEHRDLANRFGVDSLPTDIFLDPNGFVLDRSSGMSDRQRYLSLIARVDSRFCQTRKARIATSTKPTSREPALLSRVTPPPIAPNPVRQPAISSPLVATAPAQNLSKSGPQLTPSKRPVAMVGLRGFSPVALVGQRQWLRGSDRWAWDYKGITYYLTSAEELQEFKDRADRYAPQVLGCDPVILDITDRAVAGDIHYAAFFDGELYLFVSEKSRQAFKLDPDRFVRTKHVLKDDQLNENRLE
jgi:YHS domain-containing protein/thioredoxin-related protein